jgi:hypothetical protein
MMLLLDKGIWQWSGDGVGRPLPDLHHGDDRRNADDNAQTGQRVLPRIACRPGMKRI